MLGGWFLNYRAELHVSVQEDTLEVSQSRMPRLGPHITRNFYHLSSLNQYG